MKPMPRIVPLDVCAHVYICRLYLCTCREAIYSDERCWPACLISDAHHSFPRLLANVHLAAPALWTWRGGCVYVSNINAVMSFRAPLYKTPCVKIKMHIPSTTLAHLCWGASNVRAHSASCSSTFCARSLSICNLRCREPL